MLQSVLEPTIGIIDAVRRGQTSIRMVIEAGGKHGSLESCAIKKSTYDTTRDVVKHYMRLSWGLKHIGIEPSAENIVLAYALWVKKLPSDACYAICARDIGHRDAGSPIKMQRMMCHSPFHDARLSHPEMPEHIRYECPEHVYRVLQGHFNGSSVKEFEALMGDAGTDMRINPLKADRETVIADMSQTLRGVQASNLSPLGVRFFGWQGDLFSHPLYQSGHIEFMDIGSQLIALLAHAQPGENVLDFCAGAGGKTMVMAADMQNTGKLTATDISARRLASAKERCFRAGIDIATFHKIGKKGDAWLDGQRETFDRLLIDAPCSGTGTWRRNPEARFNLTEGHVAHITRVQAGLLDRGTELVKRGGFLVYATCSLLPGENHDQVAAFLRKHPGFSLVSPDDVRPDVFSDIDLPDRRMMNLSPHRHGTDGFFCAVLYKSIGYRSAAV